MRERLGASGAEKLCALGAIGHRALLGGPSTSPLEVTSGNETQRRIEDALLRSAPQKLRDTRLCSPANVFVAPSRVRARPSGASMESWARANADLAHSRQRLGAAREARIAFVPSAGRAYLDTMSSSVAAVGPRAHSNGLCGDF